MYITDNGYAVLPTNKDIIHAGSHGSEKLEDLLGNTNTKSTNSVISKHNSRNNSVANEIKYQYLKRYGSDSDKTKIGINDAFQDSSVKKTYDELFGKKKKITSLW